ncbi:MAG: DUF58 domain-containing protein [Thermoplasmatota archaeon]
MADARPGAPAKPAAKPAADASPATNGATFTNKGLATTKNRLAPVVQGTTLPSVEGVPIDPATIPPEAGVGPTGKPLVPGATVPEDTWLPAESVAFEHACCKAVRPNPDDPDVPSGPPEPYLTWQSPVRATAASGILILGAGLLLATGVVLRIFDIADVVDYFLMGVAAVLFVYLILSRISFGITAKRLEVAATRHIMDEKLERGKLFHARLDTLGTRVPGMLRARILDKISPGLRPIDEPRVDGQGSIHYKVRPQGRGLLTFDGLSVELRSPVLWRQDRDYRLRTTVEVLPSLVAGSWRAILSGYVPFGLSAPQSLVKLYREVEHEQVKDFGLGDRPKDIDWKYFARSGSDKLIVRRRWTEPEQSILMAFDCGASMTVDQAGFRTLDMALELAHEFLTYGLRRNHEVGLFAFDETHVIDHVKPTRKKTQAAAVVEHLRHVGNHHLREPGEKPVKIQMTGDPQNLRMGISNALKQRQTAMMTVLLFSDLQTTPEEIVQAVSKAATSGMRACVFLLPPPKLMPIHAHKKLQDQIEEQQGQAEDERRSIDHTNRMRELLLANGVDFQEIHPEDAELALEKELTPEQMQELGITAPTP